MSRSLVLDSPAKVNLGLKVLDERGDGYHDIETILQEVGLCDRITIEERGRGIEVNCVSPGVPQGRENLAHEAARRTLEAGRCGIGVRIEIEKTIPAGAGLGGASSNAASVVKGLDELFSLRLDQSTLWSIARGLGSDVPFFLRGGAAIARGRGDELEYLAPHPGIHLVIAYPGFHISTAWAYGVVNSGLTPEDFDIRILASALVKGDLYSLSRGLYNSFEEAVFKYYPEIAGMKKRMMELGALGCLLSGSGSCVFCLTEAERTQERMALELEEEGILAFRTTTV